MRHFLLSFFLLTTVRQAVQTQQRAPVDGVAMVREMQVDPIASDGPTMSLRYDAWVLFRGGIALRGIPMGAPSDWNADSLATATPQFAGRWSEKGGTLRVVTSAGTERVFTDWFRMTPGGEDERPSGIWMRAAFVSQPSGGGRSSSASAVRQLALFADGRFEQALAGGAATGGAAGSVTAATQRGSSGRYKISGYEIEFQYADGRVVRELFCYSSDGYGTLLIGRARMTKRK